MASIRRLVADENHWSVVVFVGRCDSEFFQYRINIRRIAGDESPTGFSFELDHQRLLHVRSISPACFNGAAGPVGTYVPLTGGPPAVTVGYPYTNVGVSWSQTHRIWWTY